MSCIFKAGGLNTRWRLGAVLLADSAANDIGGVNALAIEMQGVPLLKRALFALSGAGVDEVAVVLGHDFDALDEMVCAFPVTVAHNAHYRDGGTTSVRAGLAALNGPFNAVLVCHANQPLLNAGDLQALIGAFKKRGGSGALVPKVNGKLGYPTIVDWATHEAVFANDDFASGQFAACESGHATFDTDNDHYTVALASQEDLRALENRLGMRLGIPEATHA